MKSSHKSLQVSSGLMRHCMLRIKLMENCICAVIMSVKFRIIKILLPKRVVLKINQCYADNLKDLGCVLQIVLLHLFPELTTISFLSSASRNRKHDRRAGEVIHREKITRRLWYTCSNLTAQKNLTWIKERIKIEEKIVSLWNYHALQKTQIICMVVLMLHQQKKQYKPSEFIRKTESPQVYKQAAVQ